MLVAAESSCSDGLVDHALIVAIGSSGDDEEDSQLLGWLAGAVQHDRQARISTGKR
jgi:hypothetical protein